MYVHQHVLAQRHPRSNMKYLTGLGQNLAVPTSTSSISQTKNFASLAIISQNPGFIDNQVRERSYVELFMHTCWQWREEVETEIICVPGTCGRPSRNILVTPVTVK